MLAHPDRISLSHDRWIPEPHAHGGAGVLDMHLQTLVVREVPEGFAQEIAMALNSPGACVSPAATDVAAAVRRLLLA